MTVTTTSLTPPNKEAVSVNGVNYDVEKWKHFHPGGHMFIERFGGQDVTEAFYTYHRRPFPHSKMSQYRLAENEKTSQTTTTNSMHSTTTRTTATSNIAGSNGNNDTTDDVDIVAPNEDSVRNDDIYKDYFELCDIVNKLVPNKGFAPTEYWIKIALLLFITISLDIHAAFYGRYFISAIITGLCYAFIGLNIQHDANHGSLSLQSPNVNFLLGLTQNYIGGNNIDWIDQHVTGHHIMTNICDSDPDLGFYPLLRLQTYEKPLFYHRFQHIYFWILEIFFGAKMVLSSLIRIPKNKIDMIFLLFHWIRFVLWPIYFNEVLYTIILSCVGGGYLAFYFGLSHLNGEAIVYEEKYEKSHKKISLLRRQVETSTNVGGNILCFFNGGLNYQIEHHLFPRINHNYYPIMAPIVKKFCQAKGIKYAHFDTVWDNFMSTVNFLYQMSK